MFCAALARGRPCCACDNIQLKHMGQNNNTTTYRTHIKHDLSCGCLGWVLQVCGTRFRATVRFLDVFKPRFASVFPKRMQGHWVLRLGPWRFRASLSFVFFGVCWCSGVAWFWVFAVQVSFKCTVGLPPGLSAGCLGHISLENSHHNPCATCICGYEQCNGISTLPLYACNVQLHQVAA